MPTIRIRNVPDEARRRLEAHAAEAGVSLSEFLLRRFAAMVDEAAPEALRAAILVGVDDVAAGRLVEVAEGDELTFVAGLGRDGGIR